MMVTAASLLSEAMRALPAEHRPSLSPEAAALDAQCSGVSCDSRHLQAGSVFVALEGLHEDGLAFAPEAILKGAVAIVAERAPDQFSDVPWVIVPDARLALAFLAAKFYGDPSHSLQVIGTTGTNGKTTTTWLVQAICEAAGLRCGLVSTVAYRAGAHDLPAPLSTPEAPELQRLMRDMVDSGCSACALEVSSHALAQKRVDVTHFSAAIFTNLTRDHLDFHPDTEAYFASKRRLFEILPSGAPAVINLDDSRGETLAHIVDRPVTYAVNRAADVTPGQISGSLDGLKFEARTPQGVVQVNSSLVGKPNVYNILAAVGAGTAVGLPLQAIEAGVADLSRVPGRFQVVTGASDDITVVVDYAHTDDSLRNLLETTRAMSTGRVISVFGAGGDRDRKKRPLMGMVVARLSDVVVLTTDNPRGEDPARIIEDVKRGAEAETKQGHVKLLTLLNRREAIHSAVDMALQGDVVLIAGKGHETYQEIEGDRVPFNDVEVVKQALEDRRTAAQRP